MAFSFYPSVKTFLLHLFISAFEQQASQQCQVGRVPAMIFVLIAYCLIFKATHLQKDGLNIYVIRGFVVVGDGGGSGGGMKINMSPAATMMIPLCKMTVVQDHSRQSNRPCASANSQVTICQYIQTADQ